MNNPKISIIVAMYNIEDYIIPCLESCAQQQNVAKDDYEVIIVNDGSTDNSPLLVQNFIDDKLNFRMLTQINGGLSAARNTGLGIANGEYVWFVDGDDKISPKAIAALSEKIKNTHCDAYIINFCTFNNEGINKESKFTGNINPKSGKDYHNQQLRILPMMAWLTIFKREFLNINHLSFCPKILHEDFEFSIKAHHLSKTILFCNENLYYYRLPHSNSIMAKTQEDNTSSIKSYVLILESWNSFFEQINEKDTKFFRFLRGVWATMFFKLVYSPSFKKERVQDIMENKWKYYSYLLSSRSTKKIMILIIIIVFPNFIIRKIINKNNNMYKYI